MAKVKNNLFTKGVSGMVGKTMVFRQSNGETYLSAAPVRSDHEPSAVQIAHQQKFQQAVIYAKSAIKSTATKDAYLEAAEKTHRKNAYVIAVADYFHAPDIKGVDLTGYTGEVGSQIHVKIVDDFKVDRVVVEIYPPKGLVIESGNAVLSEDGLTWIYTATVVNPMGSQTRIVVKAYDLPGNLTQVEEQRVINN